MKEWLVESFGAFAHEIVFLHVVSAFIWVGGMIVIRFSVHPSLQSIDDPKLKLGRILTITGKFFHIVIPFIIIIIITAIFLSVGLGFRVAAVDPSGEIISQSAYSIYQIVHVKEVIWMVMTANFTYMYTRRYKAQKLFDKNNISGAKEMLSIIPKILLPINIILGITALWFGITLRGF